jgi:hypothetical protein
MEPRNERAEALDLPSLEMPEMPAERRDFRDLWPVEGFQVPEEPIGEALHPEEEEREPVAGRALDHPAPVEEQNGEQDKEEITRVDTLPEVITADMLRARKNKGIDLSQDFVVPAELLVGMDEEEFEEEWEEQESDKRGRGGRGSKAPAKPTPKGKAKKPSKTDNRGKGKKWRPQLTDDDF